MSIGGLNPPAANVPAMVEDAIRRHLGAGNGILKVAALAGCGRGTVQRVKREMAGVLVGWHDSRAWTAGDKPDFAARLRVRLPARFSIVNNRDQNRPRTWIGVHNTMAWLLALATMLAAFRSAW